MRNAASARFGNFDPASDPMATPEYRIRAMLESLDERAHAMERKWGVGRLRLLVSDLLRIKFDAQKERLDEAIRSGQERYIALQVDGMKRAWASLDKAAHEAGEQPLAPAVWECVLPSTGEIVSLVRTEVEAHHVARECRVFTVTEIAQLIEAAGNGVLEVKRVFPGATITGIRRKAPVDWSRGDEIPTFGNEPPAAATGPPD